MNDEVFKTTYRASELVALLGPDGYGAILNSVTSP
jgi:hypothetical protein